MANFKLVMSTQAANTKLMPQEVVLFIQPRRGRNDFSGELFGAAPLPMENDGTLHQRIATVQSHSLTERQVFDKSVTFRKKINPQKSDTQGT